MIWKNTSKKLKLWKTDKIHYAPQIMEKEEFYIDAIKMKEEIQARLLEEMGGYENFTVKKFRQKFIEKYKQNPNGQLYKHWKDDMEQYIKETKAMED